MTQKKAPMQLKRASEEKSSSAAGKAGAGHKKGDKKVELKAHAELKAHVKPNGAKVDPKKAAVVAKSAAHPTGDNGIARAARRSKAADGERPMGAEAGDGVPEARDDAVDPGVQVADRMNPKQRAKDR